MSEYTTAFTAGPLMPEKTAMIVEEGRRGSPLDEVDWELLDSNSWRGRRRKMAEIKRRLEHVPRSVWEDLPDQSIREQTLVLYYCCLKTYRLLFDFHMDVVLPTWRSSDRTIESYDVRRFLEQRADRHTEVDGWSESSWQKVRQVILQMLRESGLLVESRLRKKNPSDGFWNRFVNVGDVWFLEACFLNEEERRRIVETVRT
jgi:hypothetical protein